MGKNELANKKDNTMSITGAQTLCENIHKNLALVNKGYIAIMPDLAKLRDCKGFKALGYQNIDELATNEFGMSHGTVAGLNKVWKLVGTVNIKNEYHVIDKYKDYSYSQLYFFANDKAKK